MAYRRPPPLIEYINKPISLVLENKALIFDNSWLESNPYTAVIMPFIKPKIPVDQYHLKYVEGTSLSISLSNHYEENITQLDQNITIKIDLQDLNLKNLFKETLKIYFWNDIEEQWEAITSVYDAVNNSISGETNHLSHFAVMGTKTDISTPTTELTTIPQENNWFVDYPKIELTTTDLNDKIFYAINKKPWQEYTNPFYLLEEGIVTIEYRSMGANENLEPTKSKIIKIDTQGKFQDQLKIEGNAFTTMQ